MSSDRRVCRPVWPNQLDNRVAASPPRSSGACVSIDELRECGLTRHASRAGCAAAGCTPFTAGFTPWATRTSRSNGRFLAATKACGRAVLSHYSAATLHGLVQLGPPPPRGDRPESAPPHRASRTHRSNHIEATQRYGHPGHYARRAPSTTSPQCCRSTSSAALTRQAMSLKLVTIADLTPATGNLARIVATGHSPTRSELEDAVLALIAAGGFAPPDVNVPLTLKAARVIPDFRWPAQRLVHRGRRRRLARPPPRPRGRRRAPGDPRGPRRARRPRHMGAGDTPRPPDARAHRGRRRS